MSVITVSLLGTWSYAPGDSTCIGSLAAILVIEILVAICSLTVIIVVIWLWLRGRRAGSIDVTRRTLGVLFTEETVDSSVSTSRTTRTENEKTRTKKAGDEVKKNDDQEDDGERKTNEMICRIGPEGVVYESVS